MVTLSPLLCPQHLLHPYCVQTVMAMGSPWRLRVCLLPLALSPAWSVPQLVCSILGSELPSKSSAVHCTQSSTAWASTLDPGFFVCKVLMALVLLLCEVLWELHEMTSENHLRVAPAYCKWYGRLCRSLGFVACVPCFSPLGRESSSWGMLARAALTEKLQSSSNAQCSSKGLHTFWIDEEDRLAGLQE